MNSPYVPAIGLEVHAQLLTESKMFCGCSARYAGMRPNSHVCPVDLGLPGALPVINERAIEEAIMVGLALNCEIAGTTHFDRKNYPYPDIPKGYQISQYDNPLSRNGYVELDVFHPPKRVRVIRAHLEEDTGKTIHALVDGRDVSLVDYNRSGVPLLEIVSEADMTSPEEARAYFETLREILVYLGVNSGDMQEGALRADVNVSVRREGQPLGVKVEIKNLNSFRAVERALQFEIDRQTVAIQAGQPVTQETRGWDEDRQMTLAHRSKEMAEDYRYFPEPDLSPLRIPRERVEAIREKLPESAAHKRSRYVSEYGLSRYDAQVLTNDRAVADLFDQTVGITGPSLAKGAANWLTGEFLRLLNERSMFAADTKLTPSNLSEVVRLTAGGELSVSAGKTVFEATFDSGESPSGIVEQLGLRQISDRDELEAAVRRVLDENRALASEYIAKDGKTEGPLVGKVMAATGGKANPGLVKQIIADLLFGVDGSAAG